MELTAGRRRAGVFANCQVCLATPGVMAWLRSARSARVLHVFSPVCNLVDGGGRILSLANPEVPLGPFTARLSKPLDFQRVVSLETSIQHLADELQVGRLVFSFEHTQRWNPRPQWRSIQPASLLDTFPVLEALFQESASASELADRNLPPGFGRERSVTMGTTRRLAGRGSGLTPAGDDFLVGAIHALWILLSRDRAMRAGSWIGSAARGRTTALATAWLAAAARGEASEPWHTLVAAMESGSRHFIRTAIGELMSLGHTSGVDGVAGFLAAVRARAS